MLLFCIIESQEPLQSLLLAFALSGWITARHLSLGSGEGGAQ